MPTSISAIYFGYIATVPVIQMPDLPSSMVFQNAMADIELLGVLVRGDRCPASECYAIVGGRSNARWWLIPVASGRAAASGFAMFQPLLVSARVMKFVGLVSSLLGATKLWSRNKVYLSGKSVLGGYFPDLESPAYAYFTGTDSPHRKVAVQVMDSGGRIKGFAKLGRCPEVVALLQYEAKQLQEAHALQLKTAHIPVVQYAGEMGVGYCLVTDTHKTPFTRSVTKLGVHHRAFLKELASATEQEERSANEVASAFAKRLNCVRAQLNTSWVNRLQGSVGALNEYGDLMLRQCMSHGDFTPWNTFVAKGRLYVFDWEYAESAASPGNDIIHFVLNQPRQRSKNSQQKVDTALASITDSWTGLGCEFARPLLLIYLITQALRQIERLPKSECRHRTWDGEEQQAGMLDILLPVVAGVSV